MKVNLKQTLQQQTISYMKYNDITEEHVEDIVLTAEEMRRGLKEGSVDRYYRIPPYLKESFFGIKINDKVIPVKEEGE